MAVLSIICSARAVSDRVLLLLETLRPAADELIVAVDSRGSGSVGAAERVADKLVTYEFADAIERQWAWVAGQASGDWLLWVDDDEFPALQLVAQLRRLIEAEDVTHYQLRRRWLFPTPETYLAEPPWAPEFVPRLFRLDSALVTFPGRFHLPMRPVGPFRWVEAPLYHLDLIVNAEAARRAKAASYEQRRPGLRIAGRPLNEAFYVPESRPTLTAAVAAEDEALLRAVAAAASAPLDRPATSTVIRGGREAIDGLYEGRDPADADYQCELAMEAGAQWLAGIERPLEVRVTNRSGRTWRPIGSGGFEVAVSYRWRLPTGDVLEEGLRTPLSAPLHPNQTELVVADVIPPSAAGGYELEVDLVHEHVRWFGCAVRTPAVVRASRRTGIIAIDPDLALELAVRITERRPEVGIVLLVPGDDELRSPYDVEKLHVSRHLVELDEIVVAGGPERARKRVRAAVLEARLRARRRRLKLTIVRSPDDF